MSTAAVTGYSAACKLLCDKVASLGEKINGPPVEKNIRPVLRFSRPTEFINGFRIIATVIGGSVHTKPAAYCNNKICSVCGVGRIFKCHSELIRVAKC